MTPRQCLIVDPSKIIRRIHRQIVESFGFICREAENGEDALAACRDLMPNVIISDWHMPSLSGGDFLSQFKKLEGADVCPVIICSTENDRATIERALQAGAQEYIMKPFDAHIVRDKLVQTRVMDA